jgi:hypothetical protein
MLPFREKKIIVYCENSLEHNNTFCGSNTYSSFNVTTDNTHCNHCDLKDWVVGEMIHSTKKSNNGLTRHKTYRTLIYFMQYCILLSINSTEVHMTVSTK